MPFILTLREVGNSWAGRGPFSSEHATRAEAEQALVEYVQGNWKNEFEDEMPSDPQELVRQYFDDVLEAYDISEVG
ncbi:MAG TPA: hypothetical protein VKX49_11395 [Bryobacteraceae bacterium]|nr:hypothetical protein [Bryobacteraceae bacterium]